MNKKVLLVIIAIIAILGIIGFGIIISSESTSLNGVHFNVPKEYVISNSSNSNKLIMTYKNELLVIKRPIEIEVHDSVKNQDLKGNSTDINGTKVYIKYIYSSGSSSDQFSLKIISPINLSNSTHIGERALFEKDGKFVTIDVYYYPTSKFKDLIGEIIA